MTGASAGIGFERAALCAEQGTYQAGYNGTKAFVDSLSFALRVAHAACTVCTTLHSSSRGVGNRIGTHFITVAQDLCEKQGIDLPDRDLAHLSEDHSAFNAYMRTLHWPQQFVFHNRNEMMDRVLTELSVAVYESDGHQVDLEVHRFNCDHNFTQKEVHFGRSVWVTRKGAIQAERHVAAATLAPRHDRCSGWRT